MDTQDKFNFSVQFQTDIVSYLLSDNDIFRRFEKHVASSYFTEYQLRDIIDISLKFFGKYFEVPNNGAIMNSINDVCIRSNGHRVIEDYQEYIEKIYDFSFNKEYVQERLLEFIKIQAVYAGLKKAYTKMDQGKEVQQIMEDAVKVGDSIIFNEGYKYKDRVQERLVLLAKEIRTKNQVPTMISDVDTNTRNGLGAGELGVVIGKPGGGKSTFLCNIAKGACAHGKNVIYFTLEANEDIIAERMDHIISAYTVLEMKGKKDKLVKAVSVLAGNLIIKKFPSSVTSPLDLSNCVQDLVSNGFRPDLVIADYIGIMAPIKWQKEIRHRIQDVCQGLISYIGEKYEIPVWSAHQASKVDKGENMSKTEGSYGKREDPDEVLRMGDVAEAKIALAAECTYLISLNQNSLEKARTPQGMRLFVMKNRIGPTEKTFHIEYDKDRFIMRDTGVMRV